MTEFKDSEGRKWTLNLTLGSAKYIFDKTGVDLLNPASMTKLDDNGDVDMEQSTLPRLFSDDLFIGEILTQLISKQAEQRGLGEDEILDLFDGDTLKKAHDAFLNEYRAFFTARGNVPGAKMVETVIQGVKTMATEESLGEMLPESQVAPESQTTENTLGTNQLSSLMAGMKRDGSQSLILLHLYITRTL